MITERAERESAAEPIERWSAVAVLILIVGAVAWGVLTIPLPAVAILGFAALLAYAAWIRLTYQHPVTSTRVIATYLAGVAFQIVHLGEEYVMGFPHEFSHLVGSPEAWSERAFLQVFVFGAGALWVAAGAGALLRIRIANYFIWFYALGAGIINGIAHLIFPLLEDGGYFPGLYTAPGHLALSGLLIYFLMKETQASSDEALSSIRLVKEDIGA